jgi:hypothetical protein
MISSIPSTATDFRHQISDVHHHTSWNVWGGNPFPIAIPYFQSTGFILVEKCHDTRICVRSTNQLLLSRRRHWRIVEEAQGAKGIDEIAVKERIGLS